LFARLDLDDPSNGRSTLVRLQSRTGATVAELIVGRMRPDRLGSGSHGVYIRKPSENQTWLARGSLDLPRDLDGWLDRRIVDIPSSRIATVMLTASSGSTLALRRDAAGAAFNLTDPLNELKLKEGGAPGELAGVLAGLEFEDVTPTAELPVPESGVATALFTTFDGLAVTVWLFAHDNSDWITMEAVGREAAEADAKAIDERVANWTYRISPERAKLLRVRFDDLVERTKG